MKKYRDDEMDLGVRIKGEGVKSSESWMDHVHIVINVVVFLTMERRKPKVASLCNRLIRNYWDELLHSG
jgi:hypothetical protein